MKATPCLLLMALAISACAKDEREDHAEPIEDAAQQPASVSAAKVDTTAPALWAHLQSANYRGWQKWPGKGELYKGQEPHGMLLTTYVNALALDALTNGAQTLPDGAIIVKENYMPDSTFAAATVMHKVANYNPSGGDWFWAKFDPKGTAEASGRVAMCQQCHSAHKDRDFLMTPLP